MILFQLFLLKKLYTKTSCLPVEDEDAFDLTLPSEEAAYWNCLFTCRRWRCFFSNPSFWRSSLLKQLVYLLKMKMILFYFFLLKEQLIETACLSVEDEEASNLILPSQKAASWKFVFTCRRWRCFCSNSSFWRSSLLKLRVY